MTGEPNGHAAPSDPPAGPSIVLTFAGPGAADCTARADGVTIGQLMAGAFYLDQLAREVRAGMIAREAMAGLNAAPASILDQLRRSGRV